MERIYHTVIQEHIHSYQQMLLMAGPRQVGKTTLLRISQGDNLNFNYYNWDNIDDRELILGGYKKLTAASHLVVARQQKSI